MTKGTEKLFGIDTEFEAFDELTESKDGVSEDWFHMLKTAFDAGQAKRFPAAPMPEQPKPQTQIDYVCDMVKAAQEQNRITAAAETAAVEPETVTEIEPETVTVTAQHKMLNWFCFILGIVTGGAAVAIPVIISMM